MLFAEIPECLQSLQLPCGDLVHEQQKENFSGVINVEAGGPSKWQKKRKKMFTETLKRSLKYKYE